MAWHTLTCQVCGKQYKACKNYRHNIDGVFHYQDVTCSPECGEIYLRRVAIARGILPEDIEANSKR